MTPEDKIVHILQAGKAICGYEGFPYQWPTSHYWVWIESSKDPDYVNVNCQDCKRVILGREKEKLDAHNERGMVTKGNPTGKQA